ncbi:unnamed protein product [Linum trigynum]|uniref:Uncharacterized protein n=1 Tax=Linum trigynum TaxID=586398 RepID=A0AAV2EB05_9ROSI
MDWHYSANPSSLQRRYCSLSPLVDLKFNFPLYEFVSKILELLIHYLLRLEVEACLQLLCIFQIMFLSFPLSSASVVKSRRSETKGVDALKLAIFNDGEEQGTNDDDGVRWTAMMRTTMMMRTSMTMATTTTEMA